jgi:glucose-6-phosphate isomerase
METFITMDGVRSGLRVPSARPLDDGLDAVSAQPLDKLNAEAADAVAQAHTEGGVPVIRLRAPDMSAESFGALVYFFERACVISSAISGVHPYGQPGVEAYKTRFRERLKI